MGGLGRRRRASPVCLAARVHAARASRLVRPKDNLASQPPNVRKGEARQPWPPRREGVSSQQARPRLLAGPAA